MTNLLVYDLANSLKPAEVEEFRIFLRSEYFNRDFNVDDLSALFEIIQKAREQGVLDTVEKEQVYAQVFPGKAVVRNKLEKLASDLNKMFRQFLLSRQYFRPENEPRQQTDWLKELRERGLSNRHQHVLDKAKKEIEKDEIESLDHYYQQQLLAQEEYEWQSIYNAKGDLKLPELIGHLDNYYFTYRTELLNRLLMQHKYINLEPHAVAIIQQDWEIPKSIWSKSYLIQITWAIHSLLKEDSPSTEDFQNLLHTIKSREGFLSQDEIKAFYTYLRSLCSVLIDHGNIEFLPVLHDIQKDNLARGYFYFESKILPHACLHITKTAITIGKIEWVKQFIEDHKDKIFDDGETREYYKLNLSMCLFAEKKYDEALELIQFDSSFSQFHLIARRLELEIYYEMRSELLPYKIDAFSMFIRRTGQKAISRDSYEMNLNFVNFLRQLSLSTDILDSDRSHKLIQRINAKKMVCERKWLLEKAAELGKSHKKSPA